METVTLNIDDVVETILALPTAGGVFSVERDGQFQLAALNERARVLFQTRRDDPAGLSARELRFSPNAAASVQAMAEQCLESRQTETFEETFVLRDGSTVHIGTTWVPILANQEPPLLIFTCSDITESVNVRMRHARELSFFASGFVQTCAWCGNVQTDDGWVSAPEYVDTFGEPPSRTRCPDCRRRKAGPGAP